MSTIPPDGEGLQPPFDRRRLCTAERIRKRRCAAFYLSEDTFDSVPISVATHPNPEPEPQRGPTLTEVVELLPALVDDDPVVVVAHLIMTAVRHFGIDRTTVCGRTGKQVR